MNILCDKRSLCIDPANPFQNFSSEDPDVDHVFCYGGGTFQLRLGETYNPLCQVVFGPTSKIGTDAYGCDLNLQTAESVCQDPRDGGGGGGGGGGDFPPNCPEPPCSPVIEADGEPKTLFGNNFLWGACRCTDGSYFYFPVFPNVFYDRSQEAADKQANTYGDRMAALSRVCLSELILGDCTTDGTVILQIQASGPLITANPYLPVVWSVDSGSLPTGLNLIGSSPLLTIAGTPAAAGNFTFTIRCTLSSRAFMDKTYYVEVLPNAIQNTAYTNTLAKPSVATGSAAATGTLPHGLYLASNISGQDILTGTPDTAQTCCFKLTYGGTPVPTAAVAGSAKVTWKNTPSENNVIRFVFDCTGLTKGTGYRIQYDYTSPAGAGPTAAYQWFVATDTSQTVYSPAFASGGVAGMDFASAANFSITAGDPPVVPVPSVTSSASPYGGGWYRCNCSNLAIGETYQVGGGDPFLATDSSMSIDQYLVACSSITHVPQPPNLPTVAMGTSSLGSGYRSFSCSLLRPGYQYRITVMTSTGYLDLHTFTASATAESFDLSIVGLGTVTDPTIVYLP